MLVLIIFSTVPVWLGLKDVDALVGTYKSIDVGHARTFRSRHKRQVGIEESYNCLEQLYNLNDKLLDW